MLNHLIKAGLFYQAWRWLRPRAKWLAFTILTIVVAWLIHGEYLEYVDRSGNNTYLGATYVLKWSITTVAPLLCWFALRRVGRRQPDKVSVALGSKRPQRSAQKPELQGDGFDHLRQKHVLEGRADKVLKENKARD